MDDGMEELRVKWIAYGMKLGIPLWDMEQLLDVRDAIGRKEPFLGEPLAKPLAAGARRATLAERL